MARPTLRRLARGQSVGPDEDTPALPFVGGSGRLLPRYPEISSEVRRPGSSAGKRSGVLVANRALPCPRLDAVAFEFVVYLAAVYKVPAGCTAEAEDYAKLSPPCVAYKARIEYGRYKFQISPFRWLVIWATGTGKFR